MWQASVFLLSNKRNFNSLALEDRSILPILILAKVPILTPYLRINDPVENLHPFIQILVWIITKIYFSMLRNIFTISSYLYFNFVKISWNLEVNVCLLFNFCYFSRWLDTKLSYKNLCKTFRILAVEFYSYSKLMVLTRKYQSSPAFLSHGDVPTASN